MLNLLYGHSPTSRNGSCIVLRCHRSTAFLICIALALIANSIACRSRVEAAPRNPPADEWNTVAANPARTSSLREGVVGELELDWYRPVEAYIPQNVQIITANGLLYLSTAGGLYALRADTGELAWRYDTELPLGHSPTVVDGVAYVGGFDRKLHAVDALAGPDENNRPLWTFDGAQAGYSSNPVVVEGVVYTGNRDGYVYAIGAHGTAKQGQLIWRYKTDGPIFISPAYKNNTVYIATNNYAYALQADTKDESGKLLWRSEILPGISMQAYWPVVYTEPSSGKDYVIFSGSMWYAAERDPGVQTFTHQGAECPECPYPNYDPLQRDEFFPPAQGGELPSVTLDEPWAIGRAVYDGSAVAQAYESKPWRRVFLVFDAQTGVEYTMDADQDGQPEYAPISYFGTRNGNIYPPVIGPDNLLYQNTILFVEPGFYTIPHGRIMGWKFGTPYLLDAGGQGATDEPQANSVAGTYIYRNLCCDRVADFFDYQTGAKAGELWGYNDTLSKQARMRFSIDPPNYDVMWWGIDYSAGYPRLIGNYGTKNGIYHNHGYQNPLIPYQGRIYTHRSNAVIAYGAGVPAGPQPLLTINPTKTSLAPPSEMDLKQRLAAEIEKFDVDQDGVYDLLRPGYYDGRLAPLTEFGAYFDNPGDTLLTLSAAYPYLDGAQQHKVKAYLQLLFQRYFENTLYIRMGWVDGFPREGKPLPPDLEAAIQANPAGYQATDQIDENWAWFFECHNSGCYPPQNIYALWRYAQIVPEDAPRIYAAALRGLHDPRLKEIPYERFERYVYDHNAYIASYYGFLKLQELAGQAQADGDLRAAVSSALDELLDRRVANFSKDTYWLSEDGTMPADGGDYHYRTMNLSRNFLFLFPELRGEFARRGVLSLMTSKVQEAVEEYHFIAPYWFVTRYETAVNEGAQQNLYDAPALFQAKAYLLQEPYEELVKYLDVPAFAHGDLFYIQNLVAALEVSSAPTDPTDPPPGSSPWFLPLIRLGNQ